MSWLIPMKDFLRSAQPILTTISTDHALHVFINGQLSGGRTILDVYGIFNASLVINSLSIILFFWGIVNVIWFSMQKPIVPTDLYRIVRHPHLRNIKLLKTGIHLIVLWLPIHTIVPCKIDKLAFNSIFFCLSILVLEYLIS